jgi:hypothetical protein
MKVNKTCLVIGSALLCLAAIPGAAIAIMIPMMFDSPVNTENRTLIITALLVGLFPVIAAVCPILAWIAYARSCHHGATVLIHAPTLPIAGVLLGFTVIEHACGGSFSCR